jgi:S1-C subfamily serine protease
MNSAIRTVAFTAIVIASWPARAAADPADAVVLVRVIGQLTAAMGDDQRVWRPSVEVEQVQIGTGTGFIFSPSGYILTNSHVVRGGRVRIAGPEGRTVDITVAVQRIEVVLNSTRDVNVGTRVLDASVVVDDPEADLAVLHVGDDSLPALVLSDGAALARGDAVSAWGFPLGEALAIEQPGAGLQPPPVSTSNGTVATLRSGDVDGLSVGMPYVQTTAPINPGNSGGPLLDRDGYVVGIVQAKLKRAEGVGFAIAAEGIRAFLERNGLDAMLPVTRLTLGPAYDFGHKGVRLRVPDGFRDASAWRLRIHSGESLSRVQLIVDRVASPWDLAAIERALVDGTALGQTAFGAMSDRPQTWHPDRRVRTGLAQGRIDDVESRMLYAIADLGSEKVIARYIASNDDFAFNFGVFRDSLASLEPEALIVEPLQAPLQSSLSSISGGTILTPLALVPAGTNLELVAPRTCPGLTAPEGAAAAVLDVEFTIRFTATWWPKGVTSEQVRTACRVPAAPQRFQYFGFTYEATPRVVEGAGGAWFLELSAPEGRTVLVQDVFTAWGDALQDGK